MSPSPLVVCVLVAVLGSGCGDKQTCPAPCNEGGEASASASAASAADTATAPTVSASASASAAPVAAGIPPAPPEQTAGCADDMIRVEGDYCPALTQVCLLHHGEYENDKATRKVSERCMRYENPSRCVSKSRKKLSFCMDRFEFPNKQGELPRVLTSWRSAKALCEERGKRLCTEDEFNFACEGPEMLPYVYGFDRDATKCNIDKPYRYPDHSKRMLEYDECLKDERCKAEMDRMDQREPIGQRTTCVSWAGVYDLNGNANEWVDLPGESSPNRSGLKGGWWGPIRARCRPTVTFHKESDYGYEAGFRCCSEAKPR